MKIHRLLLVIVLAAASVTACRSDRSAGKESASSPAGSSSSAEAPTGKTIVVKLISDGAGNRFEPNRLEAHRGDVIRFTLQVGVHNVHFLPDSNPGKSNLPPASELLQLPGQTYDLPITLTPGKYYFQCDPHAALGMTGHLEVE
jgi:plastocyanin